MLALPTTGFRRSVKAHNVDFDVCFDWIEASTLFGAGEIAGADVVDMLRESEIYADQDFAWELVNDAFSTISERHRLMGEGYPIELSGSTRLQRRGDWEQYSAYSFCLTLSLSTAYPKWARTFGRDFTEQGALFEALTCESVKASLTGWTVHPTGWTRETPSRLAAVVSQVASLLGEATGDLAKWTKQRANEAGLDLLCFRPFPDQRVGVPVYLFQCASGEDWQSKLKTPDLRIWSKAISFAATPKKAFSTPFALSEREFTYNCNLVNGLLLDRHRLLAPGQDRRDWISDELARRLVAWTRPRVATLPVPED